jgi:putative two-component system protein, hydrogenase maturation factor HypX/HoxX
MRILLLVHSFNSLSQRLYVELLERGHRLSVELDINEATTIEAVELFEPELILAPFLKRAIPRSIWSQHVCMVVHPGPPGDRGPASLDWAILDGATQWGVTVLQAEAELDAGPIWASASFTLRAARKSSVYREEVTEAAVFAVLEAIERFESLNRRRLPAGATPASGEWRPAVPQTERRIDWSRDSTETVLRKIHASDGYPGVEDSLFGRSFRLFDVRPDSRLSGAPGELLARRHGSIGRATRDGAVWIGQLQAVIPGTTTFKQAATDALPEAVLALPDLTPRFPAQDLACGAELHYERHGTIGYLHFDFYNGALNTAQCERLRAAYQHAREQPTRAIVLMGGRDFWCNGMHLHSIEAAASPAQESWRNINAMDDLARDIIETDDQFTVAAMQGNAAAGGVFLALAADTVYARTGVTLNPHYRNMGNLFGSEYWTYLLPRRVGTTDVERMMSSRLPLGVAAAMRIGLIDGHAGPAHTDFLAYLDERVRSLVRSDQYPVRLAEKKQRRRNDEAAKPLASYRDGELEQMRLNFFGFDPSYHVARHRFVHRTPHAWTPLYLARHRSIRHASRAGSVAVV